MRLALPLRLMFRTSLLISQILYPRVSAFVSPASNLTRTFTAQSRAMTRPISDNLYDGLYRPFLLSPVPGAELVNGAPAEEADWTADVELETVQAMAKLKDKLKVLVLYGSLRERSYSKLMAFEAARLLHRLGCDVKVYDPRGLPVKDDTSHNHPKVQELRDLSTWSEAQFWCSPEQHGAVTAVFKNQIDWVPLSVGSVRPTQGRTLAFAQVNGGSQSFNTVNALRILGRWMRMIVIPNQSSLPMAWKAFTPAGRLMPSSNRDRLVDVCEELVKFSLLLGPHSELLNDRFSEREEKRVRGRLATQAEKEAEKNAKAKAERESRSLEL